MSPKEVAPVAATANRSLYEASAQSIRAEKELDDLPADIITIWHDGVALRDGLTGGQNRINTTIIHKYIPLPWIPCRLNTFSVICI